ncbi:putative negative acting factor [Diaporthe ampelina]|uniref:Putative negative acting factor n=1 Tax=Diaporthe ampelina TaxID=1214573 RepID=A0A0G2FQW7_9PEZI|nr:putative negative acting factor [Diaporthe ampelina]
MCRTRRIKCDEAKPTCNQCAKSRRQCPGYKDEFDLVFRNETKATERRAQKANRKGSVASSSSDRSSIASSPSSIESLSPIAKEFVRSPTGESISPLLSIPTDQLASCHFFSNFILVPRQGSTRGFMDYLLPLMKSEAQNSHLQHAFNACSLAHLGNRVRSTSEDIPDKALSEYTKALAATHEALKDPEASKTDGTLAAVLLLGLYENITAKEMGMFSWGSHIEGAISLVKQRGRKQLRTKTGLLLFIAVRTQMIIHTLTSGKAPIMGVDWWISDAVKDSSAAECQKINIKTSELRAEVTRLMTTVARTPENIELMLTLIRRAQTVDQECVRWMKNVPDSWGYKSVAWEDSVPSGDFSRAEVFPGRVDVYRDFYIASVWNMVRVTRLVLASVIVRCAAWVCSPVDYRTTPEYATAARTCVDTITDIIASVPYHLGWHLKPERKHLLEKQLSGFACGDDDSLKGLAGYFLTWPLGCVQSQDYTTDAQRSWLKGRLKYIADELGVKYAHILCQLNVRIPSMLIRRDGLMAQPYPMAHNFVKLMSARYAPPTAGYTMNPLQQREAMMKEQFESKRKELLQNASNNAGPGVEYVAKSWLSV